MNNRSKFFACILLGIGLVCTQLVRAQAPGNTNGVDLVPKPQNLDEIKMRIGYPKLAKEAEIQGKVIVRVLVDTLGNVTKAELLHNPHDILSKPVMDNMPSLKFSPGLVGGKPDLIWVTIPFEFKMLLRDEIERPRVSVKGTWCYTVPELDKLIADGRALELSVVDLAYQGLTEFPMQVLECKNLEVLDLSHNPISKLPEEIGKLAQLKVLKLDGMALRDLPASIWKIPGLIVVTVERNSFDTAVQKTLEKEYANKLFPRTPKGKVIW